MEVEAAPFSRPAPRGGEVRMCVKCETRPGESGKVRMCQRSEARPEGWGNAHVRQVRDRPGRKWGSAFVPEVPGPPGGGGEARQGSQCRQARPVIGKAVRMCRRPEARPGRGGDGAQKERVGCLSTSAQGPSVESRSRELVYPVAVGSPCKHPTFGGSEGQACVFSGAEGMG